MKKILYSLFFLLALFFVSACGHKTENGDVKKPRHLLTRAQMIGALADVHLLEAAINLKNAQNLTQNKRDTLAYSSIFRKYDISYSEFQENFRYYSSMPEQLSAIYDGVIILLTRRQAEEDLKKK